MTITEQEIVRFLGRTKLRDGKKIKDRFTISARQHKIII